MAAYLVVDIDVTNPAQFEEYKKLAPVALTRRSKEIGNRSG